MTEIDKKAMKTAKELGDSSTEKEVAEVQKKLPAMKKGPVAKIWDKVMFLWDVYKKAEIPIRLQLTIIGALLYLVLPSDVIPDFIPGIGLIDDVGVILFVYTEVSKFLVPKVVQKVQKIIQESYYSKIDVKLREISFSMLLTSIITFVFNMIGIVVILIKPFGEYSRNVSLMIFALVFIYTLIRVILYLKNYGALSFHIFKQVWRQKSLSKGIGMFVQEQYPVITRIYAGISAAQSFIPGLDTVPDFDLIVKDFIKHYRKRVIIVSVFFALYSAAIFSVKFILTR